MGKKLGMNRVFTAVRNAVGNVFRKNQNIGKIERFEVEDKPVKPFEPMGKHGKYPRRYANDPASSCKGTRKGAVHFKSN